MDKVNLDKLQGLETKLNQMYSEAYQAKQPLEARWLGNLRQYYGQYSQKFLDRLTKTGGSTVFINITRPKCEQAYSRLCDMVIPNGGENHWQLTSEDTLVDDDTSTEQMNTLIEQQLSQASYDNVCREVIDDAVTLGTGILVAPEPVIKEQATYDNGKRVVQTELIPSVRKVDPFNFYPEPSATTMADCDYTFERIYLTKTAMRKYKDLPNVDVKALQEALEAGNTKDYQQDRNAHLSNLRTISNNNSNATGNLITEQRVELLRFSGYLTKNEIAGLDVGDIEDYTTSVPVTVEMINGRIVKYAVSILGTLPYSVFTWSPTRGSIFGSGVPELMAEEQETANKAYRLLLDNAGYSAGNQICIDQNLITPQNGKWTLEPNKIWLKTKNETADIRTALQFQEIPNRQQELTNIFINARSLADEVTNLPLVAQGGSGQYQTQTSSGLAMLMNNANVVLRRNVKAWDDHIVRPVITRFYEYNQMYTAGQFASMKVVVKASEVLMEKETQARNILNLLEASNIPKFEPMFDAFKIATKLTETLQFSPESVMVTEQQYAETLANMQQMQQQPPQASPDAQLKAQVDMERLNTQTALKQAEIAFKERTNLQDNEVRLATAQQNNETKAVLADIQNQQTAQQREMDNLLKSAQVDLKRAEVFQKERNINNGFDSF